MGSNAWTGPVWVGDAAWTGAPGVGCSEHADRVGRVGRRFLHDVEVTGGWQKGDEAIVLVNAKNGIGWVERGAYFLMKGEDGWSVAGKTNVSYPAP